MMQRRQTEDSFEHPDLYLFERLTEAVIDSSSLIVMNRAGFLPYAGRTIRLLTIQEVFEETGRDAFEEWTNLIRTPEAAVPDKRRTDRLVVCAAAERRIPVISEDKKILLEADRRNIPYFNALMILLFLLWKREVTFPSFTVFQDRLMETARYGKRILEYAALLQAVIQKRL